MGNTGDKPAQSMEEMINSMEENKERQLSKRRGQSHYKAESGEYNASQLKALVSMSLDELATLATQERINLEDVDEVKKRTLLYMRGCEASATFPSNLGLAKSLGYSRRALEYWRSKRPDTPTAQWLEWFSDSCADTTQQSALKGNSHPIVSIFILKSMYGMIEKSEIVLTPGNNEIDGDNYNAEEIRKRYMLDE